MGVLVGGCVGASVGGIVGVAVGRMDGGVVGTGVGRTVGISVGAGLGGVDGCGLGGVDGVPEGAPVGVPDGKGVRLGLGVGAGVAWGCAACSDGTNFTDAISSLVLAPSAGDTSGVSSQPWGFGLRSKGCVTTSLSYSGGLTGGDGTGVSGSIPDAIAARLRASSSTLTSLSMPTSPMSRLPSPKSLS